MFSDDYVEINRIVYDYLAEEYKNRRDNRGEYSEAPEYLGNALYKYARHDKELQVLEIGCGAGQILRFFADKGCQTVGVELSEKMCEISRHMSPKSKIINANILEECFPEKYFDLVYMGAIIHLFPLKDENVLLDRVWKWLKPDGHIFVNTTCHEKSSEGFFLKEDYGIERKRFRRYWNEDDFEKFVISRHFVIEEKLYTDEKDKKKKWVAFIARKEE